MAFAASEDSDQLGHAPSLIRVFAVHMKKAWVLSYPLSAGRTIILLVLSWGSSNVRVLKYCIVKCFRHDQVDNLRIFHKRINVYLLILAATLSVRKI